MRIQQLEQELVHFKKTSTSVSPSLLPVTNESLNKTEKPPLRATSPQFSLGGKRDKLSTSAAKLRISLENRANKYQRVKDSDALKGVMDISFTSDEEEEEELYYDTIKAEAKSQSRTLEPPSADHSTYL